jgi:hypothetical protein
VLPDGPCCNGLLFLRNRLLRHPLQIQPSSARAAAQQLSPPPSNAPTRSAAVGAQHKRHGELASGARPRADRTYDSSGPTIRVCKSLVREPDAGDPPVRFDEGILLNPTLRCDFVIPCSAAQGISWKPLRDSSAGLSSWSRIRRKEEQQFIIDASVNRTLRVYWPRLKSNL